MIEKKEGFVFVGESSKDRSYSRYLDTVMFYNFSNFAHIIDPKISKNLEN